MEDIHGLAEHKDGYNWLPDFVYGGIDGAVTTFAVVAGVEGASLSVGIILVLGFANLFADGFSMAVGKYQSDKADLEQFEKVKGIEFEHLTTRRDHEVSEVREIMAGYGFKGKDLDKAVEVFTSKGNEDSWVDLMMRNEFNMTIEGVNPVRGGMVTFFSFILVGIIPLLGYSFTALFDYSISGVFFVTCVFTLLALFFVGAVKSRFSVRHWVLSGLETMVVGGAAAAIAYLVGLGLRGLVMV